MIPVVAVASIFALIGQGLTENAEKRKWEGALVKRVSHTKTGIKTGRLERKDPVPKGRYWIDIFDKKQTVWNDWVKRSGEKIKVITTEFFPAEGFDPFKNTFSSPARTWNLFDVLQPVPWGIAVDVGWPTVASQDVQHSDDTAQAPEPEGLFGDISSPGFKIAIGGAGLIVAAVAIGYAVRSFR